MLVTVVQVMRWVSEYQETLRDLDVADEELHFPAGADRGCALLIQKYAGRMQAMLTSWIQNIVEVQTPPSDMSPSTASR